ncbi:MULTISPECIES: hypothetical protein [Paenibacillus]|uniref:hypothetical protein n=1 Tax=Paenibacillus TaxID=44249 RepID=UPI00096C7AD1|nr:hypothetical protein [Paenibacillus odorifer]OMD47990.1 hypothetical protein BSK55_29225 [Paenibacillus odorifer]
MIRLSKLHIYVLEALLLVLIFVIFQNEVLAANTELIINESFENGTFNGTNLLPVSGSITNDPKNVVSGDYPAYLKSSLSDEWKEFTYSDQNKVKFEK